MLAFTTRCCPAHIVTLPVGVIVALGTASTITLPALFRLLLAHPVAGLVIDCKIYEVLTVGHTVRVYMPVPPVFTVFVPPVDTL